MWGVGVKDVFSDQSRQFITLCVVFGKLPGLFLDVWVIRILIFFVGACFLFQAVQLNECSSSMNH